MLPHGDDSHSVVQFKDHPPDLSQIAPELTTAPEFWILLTKLLKEGRKEMFYLTTHSTHFIYGYMASDVWVRTILIVRKETRCRHIDYSFRLTGRVLLYAPSHRQDSTYHGLCYTSCGALAGTRNSSVGSPHEGSIRWPIAPWANALTTELHLAPLQTFNVITTLWPDGVRVQRDNSNWYFNIF